MESKKITYPQYRKYCNNKSFFKVTSASTFEEIQILGKKKSLHKFEAKILPDRNFIYDLTFDYQKHWVICSASEYENLKESI